MAQYNTLTTRPADPDPAVGLAAVAALRRLPPAHRVLPLGWIRGGVFVADRAGLDRAAACAALQAACPPRRRVRQGHITRARSLTA